MSEIPITRPHLSGEEGAKLDFAIANMARRIDNGY